jgi:hypothetical protein
MVPTGSPFLKQTAPRKFQKELHQFIKQHSNDNIIVAKTININYQKENHLKKILKLCKIVYLIIY